MYKILITGSARRFLKKLPKQIREELLRTTKILEEDPFVGEKLSGSLNFLYSFHCRIQKVEYRLAYSLREKEEIVVIHFAHTRENFYDKLRRLFQA